MKILKVWIVSETGTELLNLASESVNFPVDSEQIRIQEV